LSKLKSAAHPHTFKTDVMPRKKTRCLHYLNLYVTFTKLFAKFHFKSKSRKPREEMLRNIFKMIPVGLLKEKLG
jgi:hypothetical protein